MNLWNHIKKNILSGLLAVIPIVLTIFVIQFLYQMIDRRVLDLLKGYLGFTIPGMGIVLLLLGLYGIGLIAGNVVGRQMFYLLERLSVRIPLIGATYRMGKQLSESLSISKNSLFRKSVLVEWPKPGFWAVGF